MADIKGSQIPLSGNTQPGDMLMGVRNTAGGPTNFNLSVNALLAATNGAFMGLAEANTNPGVPETARYYQGKAGTTYQFFKNGQGIALEIPSKVGEQYVVDVRLIWEAESWRATWSLMDKPDLSDQVKDLVAKVDMNLTPGLNLANPANIINGKEYNAANHVIQNPPIGQDSVYKGSASAGKTYSISGLPVSPNGRFGAFFNANGVWIEGSGFTISAGSTSKANLLAPAGTAEIVTSLQGRDAGATDFSKLQIQEGPVSTFEPYTDTFSGFNGSPIAATKVFKSIPTSSMDAVGLKFLSEKLSEKVSSQLGSGLYPDADKAKVAGVTITSYQRGINLANPANIINGKEVYNNGGTQEVRNRADDSVIYIRNIPAGTYNFSGLPVDGTIISRAFFILGSTDQILRAGSIYGTPGQITLTFAQGETGFVSSLQGRSASRNDFSALMFSLGNVPKPFIPYFETPIYGMAVNKLFNPKVTQTEALTDDSVITKGYFDSNKESFKLPTEGLKAIIFADSTGETQSLQGPRDNWPNYAFPIMKASFVNYARSGATFKDRTPLADPRQIIYQQITDAIAANETADFIIVGMGTNDGLVSIGDYTTAINKTSIEDIVRTNLYEALRWAFWKIKSQWNVPLFVCLPLQRADVEPDTLEPLFQAIKKMATRYGGTVIDCTHESGIVKEFEVWQGVGRDLYDGLHPGITGRQKQGKLIARKIINCLQP